MGNSWFTRFTPHTKAEGVRYCADLPRPGSPVLERYTAVETYGIVMLSDGPWGQL